MLVISLNSLLVSKSIIDSLIFSSNKLISSNSSLSNIIQFNFSQVFSSVTSIKAFSFNADTKREALDGSNPHFL
jgi:hypothetical protein